MSEAVQAVPRRHLSLMGYCWFALLDQTNGIDQETKKEPLNRAKSETV